MFDGMYKHHFTPTIFIRNSMEQSLYIRTARNGNVSAVMIHVLS